MKGGLWLDAGRDGYLVADLQDVQIIHETPLGWTGKHNARGWPISTDEPDPQDPPRLVISGRFTVIRHAPTAPLPKR